jgi:hypothetical protein
VDRWGGSCLGFGWWLVAGGFLAKLFGRGSDGRALCFS